MKENKYLEIIKYNKNLLKRLKLTLKNYQEFSQSYTLIELQLKYNINKVDYIINVPDEEMKLYHFFFDVSNNENQNRKEKSVNIIIDYQIKSFKKLFS